ncbi:MAG: hypothetical protein JKY24_05180 [Pseudomonadales bacterium]|nr:hypothetical protein [Pseudomonadales bacterium]
MSSQDVRLGIERDLKRYRALRRHHDEYSLFNSQLSMLQSFQQKIMKNTYDHLVEDVHHLNLIGFFLKEMYAGLDLSRLGGNMDRAINLSVKLVSDPSLIAVSLEFNALAGELDEILTAVLFENMRVLEITYDNYCEANRLADTYNMKARQIELINLMSRDLDSNSKNTLMFNTFKLAKTPAKFGGVGDLYDVLAKGFEVVRKVESPEKLIALLMQREKKLLNEMFYVEDVAYATTS